MADTTFEHCAIDISYRGRKARTIVRIEETMNWSDPEAIARLVSLAAAEFAELGPEISKGANREKRRKQSRQLARNG